MNMIMATIIIPVFNAEKYLTECIDSVLAIKDDRWQLILVNDGSTDASEKICKRYCEKDSRILYLKQKNAGVSAARNNGIYHAEGEWITFLDADDMLSPDALEVLKIADANCDMIVASYTREKNNFSLSKEYEFLTREELQRSILNFCAFRKKRKDVVAIDGYNRWSCWGRFYRRENIQKNNILFPEGVKLSEDLLFCMKYSQRTKNIITNNSKIYFYRKNNESVTQRFHPDRAHNTFLVINMLFQCLVDKSLVEDFDGFVIDSITRCCLDDYLNSKSGLNQCEAAKQLKEFCNHDLIKKSISRCRTIYFIRNTLGKRNKIFNLIAILLLKKENYLTLIKCFKFLINKCS